MVNQGDMMVVAKTEYVFVLDKLTGKKKILPGPRVFRPEPQEDAKVAEAPWSGAEWAVALRFDHPRATVLVLVLG